MVEFVPTGDLKQKFFFNVSTPVGAGARGSSRADILLVQYYFVLRQGPRSEDPESYQKVKLTGVCDDNLIAAIRAYQASPRGGVVFLLLRPQSIPAQRRT